ncbi:MAG: amino acid adenylation domain-containing protein, partial [Candidatus Binatia bacterium]
MMIQEGFVFPLSFAQQRLWFIEQLEPGTGVYNLPVAYRLRGPLNVVALERSLNEIVCRHEILRTTFSLSEDKPIQVIANSLQVKARVVDLGELDPPARELEAARLVSQESRRPFDLNNGPLLRMSVLRIAEKEHVLLLVIHHIVWDGWSMAVLFRELAALYEAFLEEKPSPLPDLPIQYADFTAWQREWLKGETLQAELSYWKRQLENAPQLLELPTDHPRPPVQTFTGARYAILIPGQIADLLKSLSYRENVTLFMTLLAAFKTLLYRYTGQTDVVVGCPIAGRNRIELEALIGFFVNTLVLRTDLSGNPTFTDLLGRVRKVALGGYEHQNLPFEKLVEELQPDRDLSRSPLFQVMFQLRNFSDETVKLRGLNIEPFEFDSELSKFDLALYIIEKPDGFRCLFRYNVDLFDRAIISRMGEHFQNLLEGIVANAARRLSELPLLTVAEETLALKTGAAPLTERENRSIQQLFEGQVERSPDAVAVVFENQQLTYQELNYRANRLAHCLRKFGAGPEVPVGICLDRSLEMVVGILAVLKSGSCYVPLDPEYPNERLAFMLEDAQVKLLLTQERLLEKLFEDGRSKPVVTDDRGSQIKILCLDGDHALFEPERENNPAIMVEPDNLAYVMYTSGSTGMPKGVLGCHGGIVNYLSYLRATYDLSSADAILQLPSFAFDASVRDLIGSLTAGARVVVVRDFDAKAPAALLNKIQEHGVSCILSIVPTLLNGLLEAASGGERIYESVRLILVSGEALPMTSCQKAKEVFGPRTKLVNQYGPTECTMTSSYCYVGEGENERDRDIAPLGGPIPNARMRVLDSHLNLTPTGIPGEIYIGGLGLARGYMNSPELTAERFIPDPFNSQPGARLYKTGDRGRYRTDGNLEFLGRLDHQFKIRGFRIEAVEVEAALDQHPAVKESVVLGRDDAWRRQLLVAYVVSKPDRTLTSEELRNFLRRKLPEYMVPSRFVLLDKLPLTVNRKIDRRALPDPEPTRGNSERAFIAPSAPVEKAVADIWRDLFKLDRISLDDNFFELGGHSLQATQVISRLRDLFQVDLPLRRLFERPTISGLARCIEEELGSNGKRPTPGLGPVSRYREFPLSFAQQRLWFLAQLEPSTPVYNIAAAFRLAGALNLAALEQSLNEIVLRHEALRTSFSVVDGQPMQMIAATLSLTVPVVDLSCRAEADRESEAMRLASEEARRPFDLSRLPLLRARLLRLSEAEHILLITMHHIVSDGWSLQVLFRELSALYRAFYQGNPSPLASLPIQYADFAVWQRDWLQGQILENQLSYWKQQLNYILPALELPADRPRAGMQSYRGARQSWVLPKDLSEKLKTLSRKEGVTLFMTLLAAFQILLYRYTGEADICVGTPIANRNRPEIEGLIGFFVNTLVLRSNLSGNPTFLELLGQVRDVCLGAYEHQDLPFEKLVEELEPQRDLSRNPLFQVMFVLQNAQMTAAPRFTGLTVTPLTVDSEAAKFDLTLSMLEEADSLRGSIQYKTDLFDGSTISRMVDHFQTLLTSLVEKPDQRLSDLPVLTAAERTQLLVEWNDTKRNYPQDKCIHEMFEAQVERTPDAVAVVFPSTSLSTPSGSGREQKLTYRELNRRANQLAHHLRKLGVGPEVLVGICMERSLDMIVGLLGILKAGGAYVPLEPTYPKARLAFMIEDTQAPVLLTQSKLIEQLPERTAGRKLATGLDGPETEDRGAIKTQSPVIAPQSSLRLSDIRNPTVICLDTDWEAIAEESVENPSSGPAPENLAYAIFTSGSTGTPKGAMNTHRAICNRLLWMQDAYRLSSTDRVLQKTPFSFDVSVWEFFWPLLTGACLVIARPGGHQDSPYLVKLIAEQKITTLHFVPSVLQVFLEQEDLEACSCLRRVICSGEKLPLELAERFFAHLDAELHNLYGPTEAAVDVTFWRCLPENNYRSVPIGRPIANIRIYLLNSQLQAVPVGVPGELHIGGVGLARGYLNAPDLTAEKFIPNHFSDERGARLYKTGDLARYLPDGNIEFLGRIDHQVKIRGVRIEPGEIEATLRQHSSVRQAVVLVRDDVPGDKRLVAYVVAKQKLAVSAAEMRMFLKEKVPEQMLPSAIVIIDALPLSPNGKIDRRALPPPDGIGPELEKTFVSPRTPREEALAAMWVEVLRVDRVGIHDNFFDLGGHSLLATQLAARIRGAFGLESPLRSLFEASTLAGLAERIESAREGKVGTTVAPISPQVLHEGYPLSFSQERFWFLSRLEPDNLAYRISCGFRLTGPLNIDALERSLAEIVRRHEALRTTFQLSKGKPLQLIADQESFRVSILDLSRKPAVDLEREVQQVFEEERRRPFDLANDLLLRATLLRLSADQHVLFLNGHHIAWDHWCFALFFREFAVLYQAFSAGKSSPLPPLSIQYKHYALWQRETFQGAELDSRLAYWKERLKGAPARLNLLTDHPRVPLQGRRGGRQSVRLSNSLTADLEALSRKAGVTLFMTFLGAFQTLLHRITNETDIVVGTPVAGRDRSETESLIGLFLNSLALRTDVSGNPTFRELLRRVREVALGAYDHQDLPFDKLVEELQPERDLTRTPIFQVFINMYNFKEAGLELDRLAVEPIKTFSWVPQFDIEFYIRERDDGTHLTFVYDSDLFDAATIARMLNHFQVLLRAIVLDPERRLSDLAMLTAAEVHQLLVEWNDTKKDYPREKCLHQLFEEQVERTPDAVAVVFEETRLTYRELNQRANQLAHYLQRFGVEAEVRVGICMERSIEMVIGLLGVLKAGGAYVPVDPSYPKERLAHMLHDAQAALLLTQSKLIEQLPERTSDRRLTTGLDGPETEEGGAIKTQSSLGPSAIRNSQFAIRNPTVVCLDTDRAVIAQESQENPHSVATAENLAYVIYTSGSTGYPKGVAVEHRQLTNYIFAILDRLALDGTGSFASVSTLAADLGNTVVFSSLCTGGSLHVISQDRVSDANAMADYMSRHPIDYLKIVPSHLAALQTVSHHQRVLPRKMLILGGESANMEWVTDVQRQAPYLTVVNHYGPTETTIGVLTYRMEQESLSPNSGTLPLGRPLSNVEIYLLDRYLNPVPIGVPGELYIAGLSLTRGYLNRPDLTAERFVPDPFSTEPGRRMYKSGDLGRCLRDGNIEFLGRSDQQVKIRGFRVEPGEIEAVLKQHPAVREAVVLAHGDGVGQKRLIGFVVPSQDRAPTIAGKPRYRLPNGASVAHLNKNETDYLYEEIFVRQAYLRHGITIKDGDCVFDVGANIGLFTLFANQIAKDLEVYSFEPNSAVFEILRANVALCASGVKLFNYGLSDQGKTAEFTFFPGFSLLSGFYADAQKEKEVVKTFMINQEKAGVSGMAELVGHADAILKGRFVPQIFTAELRTLSAIIEQENIETIDLLKVNVEKSELDVLNGIKDADWRKIEQIVVEVDVKENLTAITSLLESHGFELLIDQELLLAGTPLCYVYAIRPSQERRLIDKQENGASIRPLPALNDDALSIDELRSFLRERLPDYMVPSALVVLDALPVTPHGKIDRQALSGLEESRLTSGVSYVAPRTSTEELLAGIWADLLRVEQVGIHDNFFDLGGHSLQATQVIARLQDLLQIDLPVRRLFEWPTLGGLARCIEEELGSNGKRHTPSLRPVSRPGELPLSFGQQRLWFLDQLEPGSTVYNMPRAFRLTGCLDVPALERSLNEIVRRHEPLRAKFRSVEGFPHQVVASELTVGLPIIDLSKGDSPLSGMGTVPLSERAESDREHEARRLAAEEARRPFDLSRGPLIRTTLLRLHQEEHILFVTLHHIVSDGWSMGILFRELSVLYDSYACGKALSLPELPIQYVDYAIWQRNWLKGEVLETQLSYWTKQLENLSTLQLPTDRPRPHVQSFRGRRQSLVLPKELTEALKALSRKEGVSLFMTLLAAFQTLLHRLTGQDDIAVGAPIAGRNRAEIEGLIGFFVNTLVLRADLSGNPTFREILGRVRRVCLDAYAHQDVPFEKLLEELRPERDLSRTPLFQVLFNMVNVPDRVFELAGLKIETLSHTEIESKFDLTLYSGDGQGDLWFLLVYNRDLFEPSTISPMLAYYQNLLEAIASNPERPTSSLPLLSEEKRNQHSTRRNDVVPTNTFVEFGKPEIDALPLPPNGKLNPSTLQSRDGSRRELEESFAAPRTPVEKALAKIWAEVLNLDRVGSNDN